MKTFFLNKQDGQIINKTIVAKNINELADGRYMVKIENAAKRSHNQNNWLHAVCDDIQEALYNKGYREVKTKYDAKAVVKALFAKKLVRNENSGDEIVIIQDTSDMTKEEFSKFAEEVIDWGVQYLEINIAPPSSQIGLFDVSMEAFHDREVGATVVR